MACGASPPEHLALSLVILLGPVAMGFPLSADGNLLALMMLTGLADYVLEPPGPAASSAYLLPGLGVVLELPDMPPLWVAALRVEVEDRRSCDPHPRVRLQPIVAAPGLWPFALLAYYAFPLLSD